MFLILLLAADFTFIVLHIINSLTPILDKNKLLMLDFDRGFPEIYQYVKFLWIILLLIYLIKATRSGGFIAWALVFTYFLGDDAFRIHERGGAIIAKRLRFHPPFNLRLQDFGEIAVSLIAAGLLLLIMILSLYTSTHTFRKITKDLLLFVFAIAFFGVFIDMIHSAMQLSWGADLLFRIIEDGGEMVFVSLTLWYLFFISVRKGKTDQNLCDLIHHPSNPREKSE